MQSQTTNTPVPNGHVIVPLVTIRQPVCDLRGRPFIVTQRIATKEWRLEMHTPKREVVGHLHVQIVEQIGRIEELFISDKFVLPLPAGLRRRLGRFGLPWLQTGYRNCGLGSLLLIHGLQVAHELRLRGLLATLPTTDANALRLFKNLGFSAHQGDAGTSVWYRLSN